MDESDRPDSPEKFVARLRAIGEAAYHDKHPFHVLMHQGKLTRRQLQAWIENRFYYQWTIPKKDALILAKADDPEFRRAWITRITDHDGIGDNEGGIRKWYKLSEAAAVSRGSAIFQSEKFIRTSTIPILFSMKTRLSGARSKKRDGKLPKTAWTLRCDSKREQHRRE